MIAWNAVGLALVLTILTLAILSAPSPFQRLAFAQPNVAIQYVPFVLLAAVIVPVVVYTHVTDLVGLVRGPLGERRGRSGAGFAKAGPPARSAR